MDTPTKRCRDCGNEFPYSELVRNSHCPGGVDALCKACRRIKRRQPPRHRPGFKVCRDCGIEKPYSELVSNPTSSGGVRALCKTCKAARTRKDYHSDLEESRQQNKEKKRKQRAADPDKSRETNRRWRLENPDSYRRSKRQSDQAYYRRNQKRLKNKVGNYQRSHPENWRVRNARRRARKRQAEGKYTAKDVQAQYDKQQGLCYWCSQPLTEFHADHIIPLSRGGTNWPSNIVCTCPTCNHTKSARLPYSEWQPPNPLQLDGATSP